jgi:hypothetical protein
VIKDGSRLGLVGNALDDIEDAVLPGSMTRKGLLGVLIYPGSEELEDALWLNLAGDELDELEDGPGDAYAREGAPDS